MNIDLTIGWTMSDRANGYSSFDGYRPGARQHSLTVTVDADVDLARPEDAVTYLAECAFHATNAPFVAEGSVAAQIAEQIAAAGYRGEEAGHYSLSVGDTVTVSEVTMACARFGWERVTLAPAGV